MKYWRTEITESRTITVDVEAEDAERAKNIAEEQYYADHSSDEEFSDFVITDITEITEQEYDETTY